MNQESQGFPELASFTNRFTMSTGGRLTRCLVRALRGRAPEARASLRDAVSDATHELRAQGLDDGAVLDFFGRFVEIAGRACGADRPSLMSGELRWVPVRDRVLEFASSELGSPTLSFLSEMGAPTPR